MLSKQLVNHSFLYLIATFFCIFSPTSLYADIETDGTVGAAQTLTGPDYTIPETLGTIKGDNLFHSFEKFSIKTQESATFTGSDSIKNVISRVTGGEKSEIDGTLRSNVGNADFYFINPNGVVFGQNAKVDVPAAFHVSTTDELKFKDGSSFKSSKAEQSTLTQAPPEAFGFLGTQSASIEINGSTLEFKPESKVSLTSSKDITIQGNEEKFATLENVEGEIQFKAKGGFVMDKAIVAVGGNGGGNVSVKATNAKIKMAAINADNIGDKDSNKGVDIEVSDKFELSEGSSISSSTWSEGDYQSDGDAGYVKINAGNIKIDGSGIVDEQFMGIWSDAYSTSNGNAGNIVITTSGILEILNNAQISSCTSSMGDAGNIKINANEIKIYDDGKDKRYTGIWSDAYLDSIGNAGRVEIEASNLLSMINDSRISSDTYSKGDSGIISIDIAGLVELLNGATISSTTFENGDAGLVSINAQNLKIDGYGSGIWSLSYIGESTFNDNGGDCGIINITADGLIEILNGGQILGASLSKGDTGNINVKSQTLIIDGQNNINTTTGIINDSYFQGNAGLIEVEVSGLLEISNIAQISTTAYSEGDAGKIKINAQNLKIDNNNQNQGVNDKFTGIWSDAGPKSTGNAGEVEVNITKLTQILNEGQISSDTYGEGYAGSVLLNTRELFMAVGGYMGSAAYINSKGYVGDIKINANSIKIFDDSAIHIMALNSLPEDKLNNKPSTSIDINSKKFLIDDSYISSVSWENVPASPINIKSEQLTISNDSRISSAADMADGGDIAINGKNIFLNSGLIITSVFEENGNGGDITIRGIDGEDSKADFLIMKGGFIKANTEGKDASGGEININVKGVIVDQNQEFKIGGKDIIVFEPNMDINVIQAAAPNGNKGEINITGITLNMDNYTLNVPAKFLSEVELATDFCRTIGISHESSLVYEARGGFPAMPSEPSTIFYDGYRLDDIVTTQAF